MCIGNRYKCVQIFIYRCGNICFCYLYMGDKRQMQIFPHFFSIYCKDTLKYLVHIIYFFIEMIYVYTVGLRSFSVKKIYSCWKDIVFNNSVTFLPIAIIIFIFYLETLSIEDIFLNTSICNKIPAINKYITFAIMQINTSEI